MVPLHTIDRVHREQPQLNEAQRIRWGPMDQVCAVRPWCVLCLLSRQFGILSSVLLSARCPRCSFPVGYFGWNG